MSDRIYAPNVHLFAFHLLESENRDRLWKYYKDTLTPTLHLSPDLELIDPIPQNRRLELWKDATNDNVLLFLKGRLPNKDRISGCVCPVLIYDSYALALNLRIPEFDEHDVQTEPVEIKYFQFFNPQGYLLPQSINSSLGQTILLTAWLLPEQQKAREDWEAITQNILSNFIGDSTQNCPSLYQSGQLFENPIFEYGSPQYPDKNGKINHYLVWLFINETADENLGIIYQDLIDLFFYRHKIITAYQISLSHLQNIKNTYNQIKQNFIETSDAFPKAETSSRLSEQELQKFKQQLKTLPKLDLAYTEQLNYYKNSFLTIQINTDNYTEKLKRIQEKFPSQDCSFLSQFNHQIALRFQQQIKIELEYFGKGSNLVDKAINSIRGLVEIEQAESDRERQQAEKDLQDQIQAISVGITAGAIVASTSGLITQPWLIPWQIPWKMPWSNQNIPAPHPFLIALCLSVFCSWGSWLIAKKWIQKMR